MGQDNFMPEGWYPDPEEPRLLRWWNAVEWTEHTRTMDPPPAEADVADDYVPLFNEPTEQSPATQDDPAT